MAVVAKRKTDREEAPGAPVSGCVRYEIDPDHTRSGFAGCVEIDPQQPSARLRSGASRVSDTVALELHVTLPRRGGREPFDGHPSAGG